MSEFFLELFSEEIPSSLQKNLREDLLDSFNKLPNSPTIFLANEFFDALPIKQFIKMNEEWYENFVSLNKSGKFSLKKKK